MKKRGEDIFERAMPAVPQGWELCPFEKAVEVLSDKSKRVKQSDYLPAGKLPVIDQGQEFIGGYTEDEKLAFEGQLPVVLFGDHTRSIKYVNTPFVVGAQGVKILKAAAGFDPKYLYYLLRSLRIPSRGYSRHFQFLRKFHLPKAPEDQQKRIVAEIEKQFSRLDEAVANLKRANANLKRYKAAVLKAAVEGRLVETEAELARRERRGYETGEQLLHRILKTRRSQWKGKGKYKELAAPDTTDLHELPEGWVWSTLDQIGQEGRPIIYGIIKPGPHDPSGVPYVRVTEMKDGFVDLENLRRAAPERAAKFARATLAPGDILISKDGTIGRVAVVPPELAGGNITQHVMRAPIHELMCRDYVVWAIRSDSCQKWLTGETKGVALRGVNVEDFRRLPIPVPPVAEQKRIRGEVDRRVSILYDTKIQLAANLQRAERMRQALLARAFGGRRT